MFSFKNMSITFMRQIIIDNYTEPENFMEIKDTKYEMLRVKSDTCVDEFNLYLKWDNNKISDLKFSGSGCSISVASANIMANLLINKNKNEIKKIFDAYEMLIYNGKTNVKLLKEANCFQNTNKLPHRIKCAEIAIWGYKKLIYNKYNIK